MIVFWRVVWYRAGTFLCMRSWPRRARRARRARPSCLVMHGRRGCGCVVFVSQPCGCDTPTNASVCNGFDGVSLSRFAQQICCVYS